MASAKDVIQGLSYNGDSINRQAINTVTSNEMLPQNNEDLTNNNSLSPPQGIRTNQQQIAKNMNDNLQQIDEQSLNQ